MWVGPDSIVEGQNIAKINTIHKKYVLMMVDARPVAPSSESTYVMSLSHKNKAPPPHAK